MFFILSEEDKANEVSLRYFFDLVDLDCDGVVTAYVLGYTHQFTKYTKYTVGTCKVNECVLELELFNASKVPWLHGKYGVQ